MARSASRLLTLMVIAALTLSAAWAVASERSSVPAELDGLLSALDDDRYETRRAAQQAIERLIARGECPGALARRFDRLMARPDTSFEVRWHLRRWMERLPEPDVVQPASAEPAELPGLAARLTSQIFAERAASRCRIERLLSNPAMVAPVSAAVKRRLDDEGIAPAERRHLERIWDELRPIWSATEPADWDLPDVATEQIDRWVAALFPPSKQTSAQPMSPARLQAQRELRDLLMRDPQVPRVRRAIERRMAARPDATMSEPLQRLYDASRPGLVAEYWLGRRHLGEQHLVVGVASQTTNAPRPSHFDYIDDRRAHCVTGSSLGPGDYPVDVAFPHPRSPRAFFRLVNLPTPRRRMAYERHLEQDEANRLRQISRRTLERFLEREEPLDPTELAMLQLLDPAEVSRFAGRYLLMVDERPLTDLEPRPDPYNPGGLLPMPQFRFIGGQLSHHGWVCFLLAREGTHAAVPGLLKVIDQQLMRRPSSFSPLQLDWLAAMSIARRDPWGEVDAWLVESLANDKPLRIDTHQPATVGATAAAMLLTRHDAAPEAFGLEPVDDRLIEQFGVPGYRAADRDALERVEQWWRKRQANEAT